MWPGFYVASAAWLFFLVAPLVLFYFLKLRRPRREVSSLVLWRQVLEDHRVNSPFQKFKRNLLLLLQLLLLCLLILAAMQPFWQGATDASLRLPILIDCSASMAALDQAGGKSRLEAAKERVRDYIDGMRPDQEICLVSFSRTARRETGFTQMKNVLRAALDGIQVEDHESRLVDALRMAEALAVAEPFEEVIMVTDGNVPPMVDFELSFKLNYQLVPPAGPNLGITAFNARQSGRRGGRGWDVFAKIEGSTGHAGTALLELRLGDKVVGGQTVNVRSNRSRQVVFNVAGEEKAALELRLRPDGFDALASDNRAWLQLARPRPLHVHVPARLQSYREALSAIPDVALRAEGTEPCDLVISNRPEDAAIDCPTALFVGWIPDDLTSLVRRGPRESRVVDWDRGSGLMRHVNLTDVMISEELFTEEGTGEAQLESRGYRVLVHGHRGPLALERRTGGKIRYHLLFHTDRSTFRWRIGFPVMVMNLAKQALFQAGLVEADGARTGVLPPLALAASKSCRVAAPDGSTREATSDVDGMLRGVPAPRVGVYEVGSGSDQRRVGVALLRSTESKLARAERIRFQEGLSVGAVETKPDTERPFWSILALLAFGLLVIEWWFYQRRPGGVL